MKKKKKDRQTDRQSDRKKETQKMKKKRKDHLFDFKKSKVAVLFNTIIQ
jgi:hypothetical protein